jgi:hypothetical protein
VISIAKIQYSLPQTWDLLLWQANFDDPDGIKRITYEFLEDTRNFEIPSNNYDTTGR